MLIKQKRGPSPAAMAPCATAALLFGAALLSGCGNKADETTAAATPTPPSANVPTGAAQQSQAQQQAGQRIGQEAAANAAAFRAAQEKAEGR